MNYIVTGPFCSGKSTFLKIAQEKEFKILKSDDLVSDYYNDKDIINKLKEKLNVSNLKGNPKLAIRSLFLESEKNKKIVESILHPIIHSRINDELSLNDNLMVEVPAISNNKALIDNNISIFIESSDVNRLKYFKAKRTNDINFFNRINEYQKDYLSIKSYCDIIINNNDNVRNLYKYFDEGKLKNE